MELLNSRDAAKFLGVSDTTFWRWVKKHNIKKRKKPLDKHAYYAKADLEQVKAAQDYELLTPEDEAA